MLAIFKREIRAYFQTPIGFIFMGLFLLLSGMFFFFDNLLPGRSQFTGFLGNLLFIYIFSVPLLTMRVFSEEKKQKTDQLLLTSPISISAIVAGKFLAAFAVYIITLLFTAAYAVVISIYGDLAVRETLGSYIGFIFLGACYISLGVFISACTENQLTAGLVCFFILFFLMIIDFVIQLVPSDIQSGVISATALLVAVLLFLFLNTKNWVITTAAALAGFLAIGGFYLFRQEVYYGFIQKLLSWFSLNHRYNTFTMGLLKFDSLLYYASFAGFFLFLTVRLIEKRRWN